VIRFAKVHTLRFCSGDILNSDKLSQDSEPDKVVTDFWPGASLLSSVQSSDTSCFPNVLICPRKWRGAGFPSHHILARRLLLHSATAEIRIFRCRTVIECPGWAICGRPHILARRIRLHRYRSSIKATIFGRQLSVEQFQAGTHDLLYGIYDRRQNLIWHNFVRLTG